MDKLKQKYEKLTKQKALINMSKAILENYIVWYEQENTHELKELKNLLEGKNSIIRGSNGTFVREYQGKKHEVIIMDGNSKHPFRCLL